jgi:magnesium transporter
VEIRHITADGATSGSVDDLKSMLEADDGVVWVDIPECDADAERVLRESFGFHPLAVRNAMERNRVPKVQPYPDHVFAILHAPELGAAGHVHYVELDLFIGPRYLVSVHGPVNPAVKSEAVVRETGAVLRRIDAGRSRPTSSYELTYAIASALSRHLESFVELLTREVWELEQRVTSGHMGDPEQFLEEMFRARHGLLSVRTMATLSTEVFGRMAMARAVPESAQPLIADLIDQFTRVRSVADGEKEYLQGVIGFYQTRTDTKMTIAAERLAVIAVITLPITALSSVYGMNIIVNSRTDFPHLAVVLAIMTVMSVALLAWAKKQGWF